MTGNFPWETRYFKPYDSRINNNNNSNDNDDDDDDDNNKLCKIKDIDYNWFDKKCVFTLKHYFALCVLAKLGANAILGVSLAVCKAGAAHKVKTTYM